MKACMLALSCFDVDHAILNMKRNLVVNRYKDIESEITVSDCKCVIEATNSECINYSSAFIVL